MVLTYFLNDLEIIIINNILLYYIIILLLYNNNYYYYSGSATRPEDFYRLWRVVVCDQETSCTRRPRPALGCSARENKKILIIMTQCSIILHYKLTLSLLMSCGAPCKARNFNVMYIWTYVWQHLKQSFSIYCTMFQH
jgi:hypothetical protein